MLWVALTPQCLQLGNTKSTLGGSSTLQLCSRLMCSAGCGGTGFHWSRMKHADEERYVLQVSPNTWSYPFAVPPNISTLCKLPNYIVSQIGEKVLLFVNLHQWASPSGIFRDLLLPLFLNGNLLFSQDSKFGISKT